MAQGDVVAFDQFLVDVFEKVHNLETDSLFLGLTNGTTVPATTTADPHWGGTGTTNFATDDPGTLGNYTAGGNACANPTVSLNAGVMEFDADDPAAWAQNGSNPTDVEFGILWNNTSTNKKCICYVDLGGTFNMTTGDLTVTWGAPLMTLDQA